MDVSTGRGTQSWLGAGGTDGHTAVNSMSGALRGSEAGGGEGRAGAVFLPGLGWWLTTGGNCAGVGWGGCFGHRAPGGGASTSCGLSPGGLIPVLGPSPKVLEDHSGVGSAGTKWD